MFFIKKNYIYVIRKKKQKFKITKIWIKNRFAYNTQSRSKN